MSLYLNLRSRFYKYWVQERIEELNILQQFRRREALESSYAWINRDAKMDHIYSLYFTLLVFRLELQLLVYLFLICQIFLVIDILTSICISREDVRYKRSISEFRRDCDEWRIGMDDEAYIELQVYLYLEDILQSIL